MTKAEIKSAIKAKPIAILGFGTAGRGVRALAERMGISSTAFDQLEVEGTRQEFSVGDARQHAIAVVSPGFKPDHPWLKTAHEADLEIIGEPDFGALFMTRPVMAITGTNGKTLTATYIAHTLKNTGRNAVVLGNNGLSLSGWLAQHLENEPTAQVIMEISSFQASQLKILPIDGLIWTNFCPSHLEYHIEPESYFLAKWKLINLLNNPLFIMGQSVFEYAAKINCKIPEFAVVISNSPHSPQETFPQGTIFEKPPFIEDFRLSVAFGEFLGIPPIIWHQTAKSFVLPKFRMSLAGSKNGVLFYNDAKSSNIASTLVGLEGFSQRVLWIGGGEASSVDLPGFSKILAPKVKAAYLIGKLGGPLASLLRREGVPAGCFETLEEAFNQACEESSRGDKIVFSPAFPPSTRFESFSHRGNFFEKMVLELQKPRQERTKA